MAECCYKYCAHHHPSTSLDEEDVVKTGRDRYMHVDCYETQETIKSIIKLWTTNVDRTPNYSLLRNVINRIIYKERIDPRFLFFALNECINSGWHLQHPGGLTYVYQNKSAIQKWNALKNEEAVRELKKRGAEFKVEETEQNTDFKYKGSRKKGFGIIKRKGE